jgi:hypothetical protein
MLLLNLLQGCCSVCCKAAALSPAISAMLLLDRLQCCCSISCNAAAVEINGPIGNQAEGAGGSWQPCCIS